MSVAVELDSKPKIEMASGSGVRRALVLYHPSLLDGFLDELTVAFAKGLSAEGWAVDRATMSASSALAAANYDLVVVGTNAYYFRPDLPTESMLKGSKLLGKPCVGLVAGAGFTTSTSQRLVELLERAGGKVRAVESFWSWRPLDPSVSRAQNLSLALSSAEAFGRKTAKQLREE